MSCVRKGPSITAPDSKPYKVFEQRPAPREVLAYAERIAATGHPELIGDLHQGPIRADEPFLKLRPVSVAKDRRTDGQMLPCPRCTANRFLSGWLIYLPDLKAVAFVGNECAGDAALALADREYEERLRREAQEEYLLARLPELNASITEILKLAPRVEVAASVHKSFRTKARKVYDALRNVARGSGLLTVDVLMASTLGGPSGMRTSGSTVQTRSLSFGMLSGRTALIGNFEPFKVLQGVKAVFEALQCESTEAALETVCNLSDGEREAAYRGIERAYSQLAKVRSDVDEFASLLSAENLNRINDWGRHSEAPISVQLIMRAQGGGASRLDFSYQAQGSKDFGSIAIAPGFI